MYPSSPVLLYACFGVPAEPWAGELARNLPDLQLRLWPHAGSLEEIDYVLVWNSPQGFLGQFPRLRAIFSMGAGVDRLLADDGLPLDVPLVRMVDPSLVAGMNEFILLTTLYYHRRMPEYRRQQSARMWNPLRPPLAQDRNIAIMGLGQLGSTCSRSLAALGFSVSGWSRTPREIAGVHCFAGEREFTEFLQRAEILVCLLPLTAQTRGILNAATFSRLPQGAHLIHAARGEHLVEADLLAALERGQIEAATLDVFAAEPLPADHPFWLHPAITVVPHAAALTQPKTAAPIVTANIIRDLSGEPLWHVVDRRTGY